MRKMTLRYCGTLTGLLAPLLLSSCQDNAELCSTEAVEDGSTSLVCLPVGGLGTSTLAIRRAEPAGANCPDGGERIDTGFDDNGNNVLDTSEIDVSAYICHGAAGVNGSGALVETDPEQPGDNCAEGGLLLRYGTDANADGALQTAELEGSRYVCDGEDGTSVIGSTGATGTAGVEGATGGAGSNSLAVVDSEGGESCEFDGFALMVGVDDGGSGDTEAVAGDGLLDEDEIDDIEVVCIGDPGPSGATGATGATGTNGSNGANGDPGPAGTNGLNGARGATGTDGSNGANGATGATGVTGTDGANGATGATGVTGTDGLNGANGATGPDGLTGATGATGVTGTDGLNGATGATGATGVTGTDGLNGATGATGVTGTNGLNGAAGATGATGADGLNGATGVTGSDGVNGATGATGVAEASGPIAFQSFQLASNINDIIEGDDTFTFSDNGITTSDITHTSGLGTFIINTPGRYLLKYALSVEAASGSDVSVAVRLNGSTLTALPLDFGTSQQLEITADAGDVIVLVNEGTDSITLHAAPAIGAIVEFQKLADLL
jgi:collagen triple helix repeat protein